MEVVAVRRLINFQTMYHFFAEYSATNCFMFMFLPDISTSFKGTVFIDQLDNLILTHNVNIYYMFSLQSYLCKSPL